MIKKRAMCLGIAVAVCHAVLCAGPACGVQEPSIDDLFGSLSALGQGVESSPTVVNPVMRSELSTWMSLDGSWDFRTDPELAGYEGRWFETASWPGAERQITVPGAWEAQGVGEPGFSQPDDMQTAFEIANRPIFATYTGAAWYRKTVTIPTDWTGNQVWLKFGGINSVGWIWVNGQFLARHYKYAGTYKYDISHLVTPGQSATITVLARNDIQSLQGESQCIRVYGGLFRSVELEATPPVSIDYAYIEGDLDAKSASVHATIRSTTPERRKLNIEVKLTTLDGKRAGTLSESLVITGDRTKEVVLNISLKQFRPWSPEHPNLYRADIVLKQGDTPVHGWIERFGVKKFETRDNRFWLNNKPYFLRGYGDDHTHPLTISSPADREAHLANLTKAKAYGFNFVRFHTHVENPEYFEAADELGILVQAELPYWAVPGIWPNMPEMEHWTRPGSWPNEYDITRMSGGPVDPIGDLRTLITHFRGYVSLAVYGGGNEGQYNDTLGPQLYSMVKELDPSRPWVAQDGGKETHAFFGSEMDASLEDLSMSDLQSYSRVGSGDAFQVPILEEEDLWPLIQHEYQSFSTGPDPRLEPQFRDGYAPAQTLAEAQEIARSVGLDWKWGEACIEAGHRLQSIFHKIGFESARLDPRLDGYTLWLFVDFPPFAHNGVLDIFYGEKHSTADYFRTFNQPVTVLAQDPAPKPGIFLAKAFGLPAEYVFDWAEINERMTAGPARARPMLNAFYDWPLYSSGQTIPVEWVISNFGDAPISKGELTWRLRGDVKVLAQDVLSDVAAPIGYVDKIGRTTITLPEITKPLKATVEVDVNPGGWSNSWDIWVFPPIPERGQLSESVALSQGLHELLSQRYENVVLAETAEGAKAKVLVTDKAGPSLVEALKLGKKVLYLGMPDQGQMTVGARMGNWFWHKQAGTVIASDHPAFGDFPNEGFMNQPWFRLMDQAVQLTPDNPLKQADKLMVGRGSEGYFSTVFEAKAANGAVLVTGLDLTRKTRNMPESAYLLDQMIRYVASEEFSPTGAIDPATMLLSQSQGGDAE